MGIKSSKQEDSNHNNNKPMRKELTEDEKIMIDNYQKRRSAKGLMLSKNPKGYAVDQCRTTDDKQIFANNRPNTFNFSNVRVPSAFSASINEEEDNNEYIDDKEILEEKIKMIADKIRKSKHCVVYTGAGISTSASLPDFRGPNGCWTKKQRPHGSYKEEDEKEPPALTDIVPTFAHMAIAKLVQLGMIKFVVTTNMDNLHLRSGVGRDQIVELHGNSFKERCTHCKQVVYREKEIYLSPLSFCQREECILYTQSNPDDPATLVDSIVDFAQPINSQDWEVAKQQSELCDLSIVLGTSMRVLPACLLPEMGIIKNGGDMIICNLQITPYDPECSPRVFTTTDDFFYLLMKELDIEVDAPMALNKETNSLVQSEFPSFPTVKKDYWKNSNQVNQDTYKVNFHFLF